MGRTAIDLFCGAGGLSLGFEQAGYTIVAGNDIDAAAGATFQKAHPNSRFYGDPVQQLDPGAILSDCGLKVGELEVLIGGPPCQAYSVYNHKRGLQDARANLFREYLRVVDYMRPRWIVMENVAGINSIAKGALVKTIYAEFKKIGYRLQHRTLRAEEYGVPQERRRVVFIGTRTDKSIAFPEPTHGSGELLSVGLVPYTTISEAIDDLPSLLNGESTVTQGYVGEPQNWFQRYVRTGSEMISNHSAPKLGDINMERLKHIPQGGSWRDIPFELLPPGMRKARRSDHTKRYGRMRPDGLSCTILTKCDIHWGAYIHPNQDRAISVREAARLQSFSDTVEFQGSRTEQYVQVGNAVPPLLGWRIGEAVKHAEDGNAAKQSAMAA